VPHLHSSLKSKYHVREEWCQVSITKSKLTYYSLHQTGNMHNLSHPSWSEIKETHQRSIDVMFHSCGYMFWNHQPSFHFQWRTTKPEYLGHFDKCLLNNFIIHFEDSISTNDTFPNFQSDSLFSFRKIIFLKRKIIF
jgi:hypothetical protein